MNMFTLLILPPKEASSSVYFKLKLSISTDPWQPWSIRSWSSASAGLLYLSIHIADSEVLLEKPCPHITSQETLLIPTHFLPLVVNKPPVQSELGLNSKAKNIPLASTFPCCSVK
jgi:hypothetical protein